MAGRITLWISSRGMAERMARLGFPPESVKQVYTVARKELYIAFNNDTPDHIVEQWARAYDQVRQDGTMQAIFDRWDEELPLNVRPPEP